MPSDEPRQHRRIRIQEKHLWAMAKMIRLCGQMRGLWEKNERSAARGYIEALAEFLTEIDPGNEDITCALDLATPMAHLQAALGDLDHGIQADLLKPADAGGDPGDSTADLMRRGLAVAAVNRYAEAKKQGEQTSVSEGEKAIAKAVGVSVGTLKNWRERHQRRDSSKWAPKSTERAWLVHGERVVADCPLEMLPSGVQDALAGRRFKDSAPR